MCADNDETNVSGIGFNVQISPTVGIACNGLSGNAIMIFYWLGCNFKRVQG